MVQAFCSGEEFSIDLISDLSGRCLEAVPRSMIESKGGETIKGESLDDAALRDVAVRVAETLGIKGPACVQCFRDGDTHLVTDVNARFGGGFPVHVASGGGYPDIVLALARGERPAPRLGSYRPGVTMVRYLTQVILEHDGADGCTWRPTPRACARRPPSETRLPSGGGRRWGRRRRDRAGGLRPPRRAALVDRCGGDRRGDRDRARRLVERAHDLPRADADQPRDAVHGDRRRRHHERVLHLAGRPGAR